MKAHCVTCAVVATVAVATACTNLPAGMPTPVPRSSQQEWYYNADDGVRHYVTEFGSGDTVVVLHGGFGAEHSYLLNAVMPLANRFHFVLYDQRGSLRSPAPDSTITIDRLVRDLDGLRQQLGLEKVTFLAHSMGTVLSYAYLSQHSDHVRGLVLIGPVLPTYHEYHDLGVPPSDTERLRLVREELSAAQKVRQKAVTAAEHLDHAGLSDREKTFRWRIAFASANVCHVDRWREVQGGQVFHNPRVSSAIYRNTTQPRRDSLWNDFLPALKRFTGPISIVAGDCDFVDPQAALWRYAALELPNARLTVLHDAGHSAWVDQPEEFRTAVARALTNANNR
jgi:proline iminopeptidase